MREITTTYEITLDGKTSRYTETREAQDIRDAHWQIMYHWMGAKVTFIEDKEA